MIEHYILVIGAVVSLLMTELLAISPGGILVPGYVALHADSLPRLAATLLDAGLALGLVRLLGRFAVLFGRRRYACFVLAGFLARVLTENLLPALAPQAPMLVAVGWLIPGILAADADRQGPLRTVGALAAAVLLIRMVWAALR
jgi:poly-gamma-glutamate biosynthesis protein PgsC/CapC